MPKGAKSKPIENHIEDGTLRPTRHGVVLSETDFDRLNEMKKVLYDSFLEVSSELKIIDKKKDTNYYKTLSSVMTDQISSFISISRHKVIKEQNASDEKTASKKIDIKSFK